MLLRRFVRSSKTDDLVDEVELVDVNPTYAHIRYPDGRESTVSLRDLAPCPSASTDTTPIETGDNIVNNKLTTNESIQGFELHTVQDPDPTSSETNEVEINETDNLNPISEVRFVPRRSAREIRRPARYDE